MCPSTRPSFRKISASRKNKHLRSKKQPKSLKKSRIRKDKPKRRSRKKMMKRRSQSRDLRVLFNLNIRLFILIQLI